MLPALLPDRRRWLSFLVVVGIMASALVSVVQPAREVDAASGLNVTMTVQPSVIVAPGQAVTYSVYISNQTGLPLILSSISYTQFVYSYCPQPGQLLAPGTTVVCTATFVATSGNFVSGSFTNEVTVIAFEITPEFQQPYVASAAAVVLVGVGSEPPVPAAPIDTTFAVAADPRFPVAGSAKIPNATSYTIAEEPENGTILIEPDGDYTYTAGNPYLNGDSFAVTATGPNGSATVTIVITYAIDPSVSTTGSVKPGGSRDGRGAVDESRGDGGTVSEPRGGGETVSEPRSGGETVSEPRDGGETVSEPRDGGETVSEPRGGGETVSEPRGGDRTSPRPTSTPDGSNEPTEAR